MKSFNQVLCFLLITTLPLLTVSTNSFERKIKDISNLATDDLLMLPLENDKYGNYYIETNLNFSSTSLHLQKFQDTTVTNVGKMLLTLYSNETFIASCSKFQASTPEPFDYSHEENPARKIEFLYDKQRLLGFDVQLDIQTPAFAFMHYPGMHAVICDHGFKGDDHGYLGLGSGHNLMATTINNFSIVLNNNKESGADLALYIGSQDALRKKYGVSKNLVSAKTKENWALTMIDLQVTLPNDDYTTTLNTVSSYDVIFDLNSEIIGVPVNLYNFIITVLKGYNIECPEDKNHTLCKADNVDVSTLPTFGLVLSKNTSDGNVISLPPQLYFNEEEGKLLVKSISNDEFSLVKVNPSYSKSVVLGAPFMRYYNVHFSHGHDQSFAVTIEKSKPVSTVDSNYILIAIGIALISYFVIVGLGYLCYYREFKKGIFEPNTPEKNRTSAALLSEEPEDEITVTVVNPKKTQKIEEARTSSNSMVESQ